MDYTDLSIDKEGPYALKFQSSPMSEIGRRILLTRHPRRKLSPTPIKVLDAPDLKDDFYLNLVDWGVSDCLAIGLGSIVYLWSVHTSKVVELWDATPDSIASVRWARRGCFLAVGTHQGRLLLFDAQQQRLIRTWPSCFSGRINSLAWASNVLSSGGKKCTVYHHDVRSGRPYFLQLKSHTQEICGLQWHPDALSLASGGNDNMLLVWDARQAYPVYRWDQHMAAVKAISWSPHQRSHLVSGGGTSDKTIKYWDTLTGSLIHSVPTGSQVCNLAWSQNTDEVISSHGYADPALSSSNEINIWKWDRRLWTLSGHSSRVLYMSLSTDGNTLVTGSADETLMFWDLFQKEYCCQKAQKLPFLR
ncbi:WD40-repeat-containing domain protein [Sporodiniella umbellata]|nr:WD40-repeat-containing domain protein [Sporodiniella umbellata]